MLTASSAGLALTPLLLGAGEPGREILHPVAVTIFGGLLSSTLLDAGLFDEVRVCLLPIVIGRGATLFGRDLKQTPVELLEARPLSNGCVILRYNARNGV